MQPSTPYEGERGGWLRAPARPGDSLLASRAPAAAGIPGGGGGVRGWPVLRGLAVAGLVLMGNGALVPVARAELPGRLFFSQEERAHLDALRAARAQRVQAQIADTPDPQTARALDLPPPPPPEPFTMNGLVVRSSGSNTAWVDGQPVTRPGDSEKGAQIDPRTASAGGEVTVTGQGRVVRLKPGQTYLPDEGRVTEPFVSPGGPQGGPLGGQ